MIDINHSTPIRVRYAETDKMGVVYNGNYFTYFEVGRAEMMRHHGLIYAELEKQGYQLPLVESFASYKLPAKYDDLLHVHTHLTWEYKPLLKFEYKVMKDDILLAEGYTLHSFINVEFGRPVKPPKVFVDAIKVWDKE